MQRPGGACGTGNAGVRVHAAIQRAHIVGMRCQRNKTTSYFEMQALSLVYQYQKAPMSSPVVSLSALLNPSEFTELHRIARDLRAHFTRLYPTRQKELCPPAFGELFDTSTLDLPGLTLMEGGTGLMVFLPYDCADQVAAMVQARPDVRVHPDLGLTAQKAYYSWSVPMPGSELPRTLWTYANRVQQALDANCAVLGRRSLPLVFVAGNAAAVGEWVQDDAMRERAQDALEYATLAPAGFSPVELQKAQQKATQYSERPWFLMRYELKSGNRRLAVNLAPIRKLAPAVEASE